MTTHTPGPWTAYANSPGKTDDTPPCVMAKHPITGKGLFYVAQCNTMPDARLIAAAPALLAALKDTLPFVEAQYLDAVAQLGEHHLTTCDYFSTTASIKAAIAQAEGQPAEGK